MAETMVASSVKNDHTSRKNKKPLMEKRRRARINTCLSQLKSLVLQAIKKDSSQFSKLEKADILELTVKHLRALQRQQAAGVLSQDSTVVNKYRAGFNECAKEVVRYMGSVREVNEDVKERVVSHLANCLQVVNHVSPMETLQQQQHQQMKPLHVHIPPQPQQPGVTSVAPSVIMHTAAVAQPSLPTGLVYTPSSSSASFHSSSSASSSPQTPSPVTATLPLQSAAAITTAAATTVVTPTTSPIPGAFKLVPSGAGAVAVYVGGVPDVAPRPDTVSVDAVPLYSVSLPPHPHHAHHHHHNTPLTAFVTTPPPMTSVVESPRYENVSPVKGDYSSAALSVASLPVDLRQTPRSKSVDECGPFPAGGHCSPALADDKLWRPW
ncbi:uncharacterized protein LOC143301894 [Babylonia areolata]|uniref:uncharacterized protein LOC143301894 n=1 Tax=Babylonia areolata TaxID=304850 RepID=UPI003FD239D3